MKPVPAAFPPVRATWNRAWPWALLVAAPLLALAGASLLLQPAPPATGDLPGLLLAGASLPTLLAAAIALHRRATQGRPRRERHAARRWHWWATGAYAGVGLAALVLGHRDMGRADLEAMGPVLVLYHAVAHVVIAPLDLAIGFAVGFLQRDALLVLGGSLLFALLAAEALRRRLSPRPREAAQEGAAASGARA